MNVPNGVWEKLEWLLDLGIKLSPIVGIIYLLITIAVICFFVFLIKQFIKISKNIKESEQRSKQQRERMEQWRKKHFPEDYD